MPKKPKPDYATSPFKLIVALTVRSREDQHFEAYTDADPCWLHHGMVGVGPTHTDALEDLMRQVDADRLSQERATR